MLARHSLEGITPLCLDHAPNARSPSQIKISPSLFVSLRKNNNLPPYVNLPYNVVHSSQSSDRPVSANAKKLHQNHYFADGGSVARYFAKHASRVFECLFEACSVRLCFAKIVSLSSA
jgi:hypothetical protein